MAGVNYWKLAASIVICQLAGVIGSIFTSSSVTTWYSELIKPSFNPPSWVFGPVWITLYLMMGISLYIVWEKGGRSSVPYVVFSIQLALNTLWSILFFGLKSPLSAFIEIILLWIAILLTIIYFYRVSKISAYLLVPYILWVSFAAILNFSLFWLNM